MTNRAPVPGPALRRSSPPVRTQRRRGIDLRRARHPLRWVPRSVLAPHSLHCRTKGLRIIGEDLVVFRDCSRRVGLLDTHCSHRGTSLEFAHNEAEGTHCCYHGWLFDVDGAILDTLRLCRLNWIAGFDVLLFETRLWAEENGIGRILGARLSDARLTREQLAAKLEVSDTTIDKLAGRAVLLWRPVRPLLALEFAGGDIGLSAAYRFNANTSLKVLDFVQCGGC